MSFSIDNQHQKTMLNRLGDDAAKLIDDLRYLPFFRSAQIKLEKAGRADEWGRMIETANSKDNSSHYFAKLCKMVINGTYKFVEKVEEIASGMALAISDKIVRFGFGKYQKYWMHKSHHFIKQNSMAGFIELLELIERKGLSQKYFAKAILNGKAPQKFYKENVVGIAE